MNEEEIKCLNDCGFANVTQLLFAYVSLQQENARLKDKLIEIKKVIDGYMPNEHAMCKAFDEIEFIIKEDNKEVI